MAKKYVKYKAPKPMLEVIENAIAYFIDHNTDERAIYSEQREELAKKIKQDLMDYGYV